MWLNDNEAVFVLKSEFYYRYYRRDSRTDLYRYRLGDKGIELLRKQVWSIAKTKLTVPDTIVVRSSIDYDYYIRSGRIDYDYYTYNCRTKKAGRDKNLGYGWNLFDRDGNAMILKRLLNGKWVFKYREIPGGPWRRLDSLNQEPGFRFNYRGDAVLEQQVFIKSVSPDPDKIYLFTNYRNGRLELALYDLNTGRIDRILYSSGKYDLGDERLNQGRSQTAKASPSLAPPGLGSIPPSHGHLPNAPASATPMINGMITISATQG